MSKHYTEKEKLFIIENYELKGAKYCADILNRKPDSIYNQAKKLGIKRIHGYNNININILNNINSERIAYFMGLFWADGSIYHYISNKINNYHTRLELIKSDMDEIHNILTYIGKWSSRSRKRGNWQEVSVYTISSKPLYEKLEEYGYKTKSYESPSIILSRIPENLHYMFWRGYFDGDGCISFGINYNMIKFSGNINMNWSCLEKLCNNLNIKYSIYKDDNSKHTNSCFMIQNKKGIVKFINYAYNENLDIGFSRKRGKCLEFKALHYS